MPVEWSYNSGQPVYSVTVDTAVRVLSGVLIQNGPAVLQQLKKGRLEAAKKVRREYASLLEKLIEETRKDQIAAIWLETEHILCRWEDIAIPTKAQKVPSLAELVSETESELEDRIVKRELKALLQARRWKKGTP